LSAQVSYKRTRLGHLLTALLAILYAAGILALVALLLSWTGAATPLVIVGLTLLLALLLHPVRRGLQKLINRRFSV
jgi:fatty acid desaturase